MDNTSEELSLKKQESRETRGLKFVWRKFLIRLNLIEAEEKILEKEVRDLSDSFKKKKITKIINKF